ncbi:MAG TPA: hypothetical protein VFO19_09250 [Vicinamibacterales bacterium]|nr:hypothetical protein [Vicinamibacterales bacterium]
MTTGGKIFSLVAAGVTGYMLFVSVPEGDRTLRAFDPARLAELERDVLEANDAKQHVRLYFAMAVMLREQDRYTWAKALDAGFHRARAMVAFRTTRTHVEDQLLPDLERVYQIEREWTNASFDPKAVARAEIVSWMARRRPELSNEDYISSLIAERDGLRYETSAAAVSGSSQLQARAALLIDAGNPDWRLIGSLLKDAYGTLRSVTTDHSTR